MVLNKKKSFIIYDDSLEVLKDLSDEEIGKIFRELSNYRQDTPVTLTGTLLVIFNIFKNQIQRDEEKYTAKCLKNKENIDKRWNPKKHIQTNTTVNDGKIRNTKHTDTDTDTDSDTEKDKKNKEKYLLLIKPKSGKFQDTFDDFIIHRKDIKKPMSWNAKKLMLMKLQKINQNETIQIEMLNQSILKNYSDVFEIRENFNHKPTKAEIEAAARENFLKKGREIIDVKSRIS